MNHHLGRRNAQQGNISLLFLIALPALLALAGLALDIGNFYQVKRQLQTVADAGAIAGTYALGRAKNNSQIEAGIKDSLDQNALANSLRCQFTKITTAPPQTNDPDCTFTLTANDPQMRVTVWKRVNWFFMNYFNFSPKLLSATAVGETSFGYCMFALNNLNKDKFLSVQKDSSITADNCNIYVGGYKTGTKSTVELQDKSQVTVSSLVLVDDGCPNCLKAGRFIGRLLLNQPKMTDPLSAYSPTVPDIPPAPGKSGGPTLSNYTKESSLKNIPSSPYILTPDYYTFGEINNAVDVTLPAGNFKFKNNLSIKASASVHGTGVTIELLGDLTIDNATLDLTDSNLVFSGDCNLNIKNSSQLKGNNLNIYAANKLTMDLTDTAIMNLTGSTTGRNIFRITGDAPLTMDNNSQLIGSAMSIYGLNNLTMNLKSNSKIALSGANLFRVSGDANITLSNKSKWNDDATGSSSLAMYVLGNTNLKLDTGTISDNAAMTQPNFYLYSDGNVTIESKDYTKLKLLASTTDPTNKGIKGMLFYGNKYGSSIPKFELKGKGAYQLAGTIYFPKNNGKDKFSEIILGGDGETLDTPVAGDPLLLIIGDKITVKKKMDVKFADRDYLPNSDVLKLNYTGMSYLVE